MARDMVRLEQDEHKGLKVAVKHERKGHSGCQRYALKLAEVTLKLIVRTKH